MRGVHGDGSPRRWHHDGTALSHGRGSCGRVPQGSRQSLRGQAHALHHAKPFGKRRAAFV
jgi:hypothetical protein